MAERGRPRNFDRQQALRRAMELFWRKGFDNTSMADLTEAMALRPPSIYAAFGGKEALFNEALDLYVSSQGRDIWDGIDTAPSARAAMEHLLKSTARSYSAGPGSRGCMVVLAAPQMEGANAAVSERLKAERAGNVATLERRLKRAVSEGEIAPQISCRAIANYFATVQHGMSIQARDGASRRALLAVADCAMAGWGSLVESSPAAGRE